VKTPFDENDTIKIIVRESAEMRRKRLDRSTREIVEHAREEAELDCWVCLMQMTPERRAA
jgi:hypothetical protein